MSTAGSGCHAGGPRDDNARSFEMHVSGVFARHNPAGVHFEGGRSYRGCGVGATAAEAAVAARSAAPSARLATSRVVRAGRPSTRWAGACR